jgi:hypothetical protein
MIPELSRKRVVRHVLTIVTRGYSMTATSLEEAKHADAAASRSMGHLAMHFGPKSDGPIAARLLEIIGLTQTQVIEFPAGNFYRFVVHGSHFARGDGIVYLSALPKPQVRLIEAIHAALGVGTDQEHATVKGMRDMMDSDFEASFHFGFLLDTLDDLERVMLTLEELNASDPDFKGRLNLGYNRARPGNAEVDARLDASPVYGKVSRHAYGSNGVQAFIETDILRGGQLGNSMVIELDYVFPGYDSHVLSVVEMG